METWMWVAVCAVPFAVLLVVCALVWSLWRYGKALEVLDDWSGSANAERRLPSGGSRGVEAVKAEIERARVAAYVASAVAMEARVRAAARKDPRRWARAKPPEPDVRGRVAGTLPRGRSLLPDWSKPERERGES